MKRTVTGLLLLLCLCLFSGEKEGWEQGIRTCTAILDQIREHHPETPDETELVQASLHGMLARLDPHSYYLDPAAFRSMFEDQRGNYFGIGTRIRRIENRLTVIAPIEGTPAFQLGILPGDVIVSIDGDPTRDMSLDEAMKRLRGQEGTQVSIVVERQGIPQPLTFRIARAKIPLSTLTHTLVEPADPLTGYIGLRTFGRNTASEFRKALEALITRHDIRRLVIDLRWNTGGSLAAAIEMADFFLQPGRPIVTLRGKSVERGFTSRERPLWPELQLAVLINRSSASASEILAAALQDHGRAVIVGSRSWGKGLVETVFNLPGNRGIALTTARYHTPRGRCLQRNYGGALNPFGYRIPDDYDTNHAIAGGVIPDRLVAETRPSRTVSELVFRGAFFLFSRHLMEAGVTVTQDMIISEELLHRFQAFAGKLGLKISIRESEKAEIRREILRALLTSAFSESTGYKVFLAHDPVNRAALEYLAPSLSLKEPEI
ncbi:MAG: S41 family peptidase [Acidobacteriota bacterium]|jgi:carboxyl-terminal processing protease|nr:S41 family peptidase [Acidobacteriota bacterium]